MKRYPLCAEGVPDPSDRSPSFGAQVLNSAEAANRRAHHPSRPTRIVLVTPVLPLVGVLMLAASSLASAQEPASGLSEEVQVLAEEAASQEEYARAGAVILLREGEMTVGQDGLHSISFHLVVQILDEKATRDYSQITCAFNSHYEDCSLDYARTVTTDGRVVPVAKDAIQLKTAPAAKSYTDLRSLVFSPAALEPGAIVEYQLTTTQRRPIIDGHWFQSFSFHFTPHGIPRVDPVRRVRFVLRVPSGTQFRHHLENTDILPTMEGQDGVDTYTWKDEHLPSMFLESYMPPLHELVRRIDLSSLSNWSQLDEWAHGVFSPKIQTTQEVKSKAEDLTSGAETDQEKIETIFYFLQDSFEYIASDLLRGGHVPHPPDETLRNRYGDCKDQGVLFLSMLQAVGVEAYPVLLSPYPGPRVNESLPSLRPFSHFLVYIPKVPEPMWLDTTGGVTQFPFLSWQDQDRWAFVVDGKGGSLVKTPSAKEGDNKAVVELQADASVGSLKVAVNLEATGAIGENMIHLLRPRPSFQQEAMLSPFGKAILPFGEVQSTELSGLSNAAEPFRATLLLTAEDPTANEAVPAVCGGTALPALSFFAGFHNLPPPQKRTHDFVFPFTFNIEQEWLCNPIDEEAEAQLLAEEQSVDTRFISFRTEYPRQGPSVMAKSSFVLKERRIPKDDYGAFYDSIQEVVNKSRWIVSFPGEKAIEIYPDDARAHLNLGNALRDKGQLDEAIASYRKAVLLKSDYALAHHQLGFALRRNGQVNEAIRAYNKALEIDPGDARAHYNLGEALGFDKGQLDEAIASYRKALSLRPDYARAHHSLAGMLRRKGQVDEAIASYRKAIASYEKAPPVDDAYARAHHQLGDALRHNGQLDDAIILYRKAAEQGYARAQTNLGWAYASGQGVPQDHTEAASWYRKAAEQGYAPAQFRLGRLYLTGSGVKQDSVESFKWLLLCLSRAGDQCGAGVARRLIAEADKSMTPEQKSEAEKLVLEWQSKR